MFRAANNHSPLRPAHTRPDSLPSGAVRTPSVVTGNAPGARPTHPPATSAAPARPARPAHAPPSAATLATTRPSALANGGAAALGHASALSSAAQLPGAYHAAVQSGTQALQSGRPQDLHQAAGAASNLVSNGAGAYGLVGTAAQYASQAQRFSQLPGVRPTLHALQAVVPFANAAGFAADAHQAYQTFSDPHATPNARFSSAFQLAASGMSMTGAPGAVAAGAMGAGMTLWNNHGAQAMTYARPALQQAGQLANTAATSVGNYLNRPAPAGMDDLLMSSP